MAQAVHNTINPRGVQGDSCDVFFRWARLPSLLATETGVGHTFVAVLVLYCPAGKDGLVKLNVG